MPDDSDIATHAEPANRERSNYIVRLDLATHGMPGRYEQMWTRTDDGARHGAIDLIEDRQAEAVVALLSPFSDSEALMWEWADPA